MSTYTKAFNNPYPNGWESKPSTKTPISAEALQKHTDALSYIDNFLNSNPIPDVDDLEISDTAKVETFLGLHPNFPYLNDLFGDSEAVSENIVKIYNYYISAYSSNNGYVPYPYDINNMCYIYDYSVTSASKEYEDFWYSLPKKMITGHFKMTGTYMPNEYKMYKGASDIPYGDSNVKAVVDSCFQSVSDGKELIADAITDKGVTTSATDTFQTMATNIGNIVAGGGEEIIPSENNWHNIKFYGEWEQSGSGSLTEMTSYKNDTDHDQYVNFHNLKISGGHEFTSSPTVFVFIDSKDTPVTSFWIPINSDEYFVVNNPLNNYPITIHLYSGQTMHVRLSGQAGKTLKVEGVFSVYTLTGHTSQYLDDWNAYYANYSLGASSTAVRTLFSYTNENANNIQFNMAGLCAYTDTGSNEGYIDIYLEDELLKHYNIQSNSIKTPLPDMIVEIPSNKTLYFKTNWDGAHSNCVWGLVGGYSTLLIKDYTPSGSSLKTNLVLSRPLINKSCNSLGISNLNITDYTGNNKFDMSFKLSGVSGYEGIALPLVLPIMPEAKTYTITMDLTHGCTVNSSYKDYWGLAISNGNNLQIKHTVPFGDKDVSNHLTINYEVTETSNETGLTTVVFLIFSCGGVQTGGDFTITGINVSGIDIKLYDIFDLNYVQDDTLKLWVDGIVNGSKRGYLDHISNPVYWPELSGNGFGYISSTTGVRAGNNYIEQDRGSYIRLNCVTSDYATMELVCEFLDFSASTSNCIFEECESGGMGIAAVKNGDTEHGLLYGSFHIGGSYRPCYLTDEVTINEKIFVSVTFDGSTIKIYKNGVLNNSLSYTGTIKSASSNSPFIIGTSPRTSTSVDSTSSYGSHGRVYSARVYTRALTAEEVLQNYNVDVERFGD